MPTSERRAGRNLSQSHAIGPWPYTMFFFEKNKMAEVDTRTKDTRDSVDARCFCSHIGPIECMFSSIIAQTLLVYVRFVQSTGMYNIINKETWSIGTAHVFFIHLVIYKEW